MSHVWGGLHSGLKTPPPPFSRGVKGLFFQQPAPQPSIARSTAAVRGGGVHRIVRLEGAAAWTVPRTNKALQLRWQLELPAVRSTTARTRVWWYALLLRRFAGFPRCRRNCEERRLPDAPLQLTRAIHT